MKGVGLSFVFSRPFMKGVGLSLSCTQQTVYERSRTLPLFCTQQTVYEGSRTLPLSCTQQTVYEGSRTRSFFAFSRMFMKGVGLSLSLLH